MVYVRDIKVGDFFYDCDYHIENKKLIRISSFIKKEDDTFELTYKYREKGLILYKTISFAYDRDGTFTFEKFDFNKDFIDDYQKLGGTDLKNTKYKYINENR